MSAKNGNGQNGTQTIVTVRGMSLSEKKRIEELIDNRAKSLQGHMEELSSFALEASEHVEFSGVKELDVLESEKATIDLELERIAGLMNGEVKAVEMLIENQTEEKLAKLKVIEKRIITKQAEKQEAATEEIRKKYHKKEGGLRKQAEEIQSRVTSLQKVAEREKILRKVAVTTQFSRLKDSVADNRNKAVEQLYTEALVPDDAKKCLNLLPDAIKFRESVTPERVFSLFEENAKIANLAKTSLKCHKCGSENIIHRHGDTYCTNCSSYTSGDGEIRKLTLLPSIEDMANGISSPPTPVLDALSNSEVVLEEATS